jgi:ParB family chromosome partitioning protein
MSGVKRRKSLGDREHEFIFGQSSAENNSVVRATGTLKLAEIQRRPEDTRPISETHVTDLMDSIALLGLIEPIAVDQNGRLLAGAHRLVALSYLSEQKPEDFLRHFEQGIPVRQYDFDAESEPDRALQIEIAENEHRRDYTPAEIRAAAQRLLDADYVLQRGRPTANARPLIPALEAIFGKSRRTIARYLAEVESPQPSLEEGFTINRTDGLFMENLKKRHLQTIDRLVRELDRLESPTAAQAVKSLKTARRHLSQLE